MVNITAAGAAYDDDGDDDVIVPHPGHLLLVSLGPSSATKLVQTTRKSWKNYVRNV